MNMFKKILLPFWIFAVIIVLAAVWQLFGGKVFQSKSEKLKELKIGEATFSVEIVNTSVARARGLSGREKLNDSEGMLFIFDGPGQHSFWMKDMKFPIDIIWIADNKVVGMALGAEPETKEPLTIYTPPQSVDRVLEVNAGSVMRLGINIGDAVQLTK